MASPLWMKSWRISFIIIWNIVGELHSLKNMTVGSNSPQLVWNAAFHSSPSLIHMLLTLRKVNMCKYLPIGSIIILPDDVYKSSKIMLPKEGLCLKSSYRECHNSHLSRLHDTF